MQVRWNRPWKEIKRKEKQKTDFEYLVPITGKEILNQIRKLYVGSLEDEEEKAAMMTPEEIAKVWNVYVNDDVPGDLSCSHEFWTHKF